MISDSLFQYVTDIRRRIHRHPEIGFDLPVTTALVCSELERTGVTYSTDFAPSSVVAYFGNDPDKRTIAVRADMDALPVEEKVDLPFKSEIPGRMHACGHDTHTAILLGLAKILKERESELPCNVRLFFQPSEECAESGAEAMVKGGVMDGVDEVICTHCEPFMDPGDLGIATGDYMAACMPFKIEFIGRTSHAAAAPELGIDAIRMADEAYHRLAALVKECFGEKKYVWNVGVFQGGTAHNVIADHCRLEATFRFFDQETAETFRDKAVSELNAIADRYGGKVKVEAEQSCYAVINDPELAGRFRRIMEEKGVAKVLDLTARMSSEDFSWYLRKAPGFLFRYGIKCEPEGQVSPAHSNTFIVNEEGMRYALEAFTEYIFGKD